jgi:hypothetical protein
MSGIMELNRVGSLLAVAIVAGLIGAFIARSLGQPAGDGACDIHPRLSERELSAIKTNLARVRSQAFDAASAEGQGRDAANKAAEDIAFDTFIHNLRGALSVEYARHRQALDGCF